MSQFDLNPLNCSPDLQRKKYKANFFMLEDHRYIKQPSISQDEHLQQCCFHFLPGPFIISGLPVLTPRKCSFPSVRELTLKDSDMYCSGILSEFGKLDIKSFLKGVTHYTNSLLFSSQTRIKLNTTPTASLHCFLQFEGIPKLHPEARNTDSYKNYAKKCSNVGF